MLLASIRKGDSVLLSKKLFENTEVLNNYLDSIGYVSNNDFILDVSYIEFFTGEKPSFFKNDGKFTLFEIFGKEFYEEITTELSLFIKYNKSKFEYIDAYYVLSEIDFNKIEDLSETYLDTKIKDIFVKDKPFKLICCIND